MADTPYSIMIVDDSEEFRTLLCLQLDHLNCRFTHARDGEEAVELYEDKQFDLIIMDIIMPLMDGVDAIRAIRLIEAQTKKSPTPILALSAEDSVETGVDSMDAGATRMLIKPVTQQGLEETVRELLEGVSPRS